MRVSKTFALAAMLGILACGGGSDDDGDPTGPPPGGGGATNGTFSATLNGTAWAATGTVTVTRTSPNFIGIGGAGLGGGNAFSLIVGIANATGPGTHTLNLSAGGDGSSVIVGSSTTGYGTAFPGGTGSVTITSLTATRIVGTFSGTAIPSSGTGANMVVANGVFDITF